MIEAARRQRILKNREDELRRLLAAGAPQVKLGRAICRVREAKLSLFKGQREIAKYRESENEKLTANVEKHLLALGRRESQWKEMPDEDIVSIYQPRKA